MNRPRIVVLVSGNGSNLQALLDACSNGTLAAQTALVVSSRADAFALQRAATAGVPFEVLEWAAFQQAGRTRDDYDAQLADKVAVANPDLVVLAGWMRLVGPAFLDRFPGRVLNLHPALPGAFPGVRAIERAWQAFQLREIDRTGVMVHHVVPEVDAGPVVVQAEIPLRVGESLPELEARVHEVEHRLLVEAVRQVLADNASPPEGVPTPRPHTPTPTP